MVITTLQTILVLLASIGNSVVARPDLCPIAAMVCGKTAANHYDCVTNAQSSPGYEPQFKWSVSNGKIRGDRKSPRVTVDLTRVKSETVTVVLKIHWRNVDKVCDATLHETIDRRE
jgi:hypothetical protein